MKTKTPRTPRTPKATKQTPKAEAPLKLTPQERKAERERKEDAIRADGGVVMNAAGRPTARRLTCLCGCGEATHRDDAWFRSGHDAIMRKNAIEAGSKLSKTPAIIRPFFQLGNPIAGLMLDKDGDTLIDVKA